MLRKRSEHGQALILIALAIVGLVGMTGLVVDGGNAFLDRRRAQNAADTAALAGAVTRIRGGSSWVEKTMQVAAQNGYDNNGTTNSVEVQSPPVSGPYAGDIEYIQVIITSRVKTYLASVVGWREITNTVSAVARSKMPEYKEILNGNAVISLAQTSDCENEKAFWAHGEATLDITGGGVFVNSNNPTCAFIQQGNGSIRIRDDHSINVVGGASIQKPQLLTPGVSTGAIPFGSQPFIMPKVGCKKAAEVSEDGSTMSPGFWGDQFPPDGVKTLESGNYCIDGDFIVNDNTELGGNNVVIKVERGLVRFNGNATINLSAPKSGDLAGLLIYLPPDNHNKVILNGNNQSSFKGTILAPGSVIHINGNDSSTGFHSQIIGYRIDLDGNSNVVVVYKDDQNYDALSMPEVQISQ